MVVCGGLRWFVVVCGGLWWIAVVCLLVIPGCAWAGAGLCGQRCAVSVCGSGSINAPCFKQGINPEPYPVVAGLLIRKAVT